MIEALRKVVSVNETVLFKGDGNNLEISTSSDDLKYYKEHDDIHAMGIRADEQYRIRDKSKWRKNEEILYPLVEAGMDRKEVKKLCEKHGMLNPVYTWRNNVSCFCCFMQRLNDWRGLYKNHPELFKIAEQWEEVRPGFGWRSDKWTLKKIREEVERGKS